MKKLRLFDYLKEQESKDWINKRHKRYFMKYQSKKLYFKFDKKFDFDLCWDNVVNISKRFILKYPSIFYFDKHLSDFYMDIYLSGQILREDKSRQASIIERGLDDETHYSFFDEKCFYNGDKEISINKVSLPISYKKKAIELNEELGMQASGVGELFSVIADNLSSEQEQITDEVILNAFIKKSNKKALLKKKYMGMFSKLMGSRSFHKVQNAKDFKRDYKVMSLEIWEKEVALILNKVIDNYFSYGNNISSISRDEIIWKLFSSSLSNKDSEWKIAGTYKGFFTHLHKCSFPFQINAKMIKDEINTIIEGYSKDIIERKLSIKPLKEQIKKYNYRVRYIKAGDKTKNMLSQAAFSSILLTSSSRNDKSKMIDIYMLMIKKNINDNEIRNLLSKLYSFDRFVVDGCITQEFHDLAYNFLPSLKKLLENFSENKGYKTFYNKIIKLLISEVGGSEISTQSISSLSEININKINLLKDENFNSINQLVGLCSFSTSDQDYVSKKIESLGLSFFDEDDGIYNKIRNMMIGPNMERILNNYDESDSSRLSSFLDNPLLKELGGGLKISIVPHDYAISLLAVGVNGVCISPGSKSHAQQHRPECLNLIIHDDKSIHLWGLLIKAKNSYQWFLNNFQGRLPNRYAKAKEIIKDESIALMSEIGDVFMKKHYFNAMDLHSGLNKVNVEKLSLPLMRLDIHQDDDGNILDENLYKIERRKNGLMLIK